MSLSQVAAIALVIASSALGARTAHAEQSPEQIFAEMRRLQSEQKYAECAALGREAAPTLVDLEVVWFIVAECEAAESKWCDAKQSVDRFLAASHGASEGRIEAARRLAAESLERCTRDHERGQCMKAYERQDWDSCIAVCARLDESLLPKPKIAMLVHCLIGANRCEDAKGLVTDLDLPTLEPGDAQRIERCDVPPEKPPEGGKPPDPETGDRGSSAGPWLIAIGGGAVVTGVVFLLLANADATDLNALRPSPTYDQDYEDLRSSHQTKSIVGHSATWAGAAMVVLGVVLIASDGDDDPVAPTTSLLPALSPEGFAMTLSHRF